MGSSVNMWVRHFKVAQYCCIHTADEFDSIYILHILKCLKYKNSQVRILIGIKFVSSSTDTNEALPAADGLLFCSRFHPPSLLVQQMLCVKLFPE